MTSTKPEYAVPRRIFPCPSPVEVRKFLSVEFIITASLGYMFELVLESNVLWYSSR